MRNIKTIVLVSLVTALIWVFAEAESVRTEAKVVELSFQAIPGSGRVVRVAEPTDGGSDRDLRAEVTVQGASAALDAADALLARPLVLSPGRGLPAELGEHVVTLRDALRTHPDVRRSGVAVVAATPAVIRVVIESLETRPMRVRVVAPAEQIVGVPEPVPSMVRVTAPSSTFRGVPESAEVVARVEESALRSLEPGVLAQMRTVPVEVPDELRGAAPLLLDPPAVDVALTVRSQTETLVLPSVPVQVLISPAELRRWDVTIPEESQFLTDVRVTGPRERIEQIRAGTLRVVAYVPLTYEDLEAGITSKEAVFSELPTSLRFEVGSRLVRLNITRRASPGGPREPDSN